MVIARPGGGTGRRASLRGWWASAHAGSTPVPGISQFITFDFQFMICRRDTKQKRGPPPFPSLFPRYTPVKIINDKIKRNITVQLVNKTKAILFANSEVFAKHGTCV